MTTEPLAELVVEDRGEAVLVAIRGEIDLSNADQVRADVELATCSAARVVIDLTRVEYMDSQGIRLLHALARTLDSRQTELQLVAPRATIAGELLRLTQVRPPAAVRETLADLWPADTQPNSEDPDE